MPNQLLHSAPGIANSLVSAVMSGTKNHDLDYARGQLMALQGGQVQQSTDALARKAKAAQVMHDLFASGNAVETQDGGINIRPEIASQAIAAIYEADPTADITPFIKAVNLPRDQKEKFAQEAALKRGEPIKVSPGEQVLFAPGDERNPNAAPVPVRKAIAVPGQPTAQDIQGADPALPEQGPDVTADPTGGAVQAPSASNVFNGPPKSQRDPAAIIKARDDNSATLAKIKAAQDAIDANPGAFGLQNYLPQGLVQRLPQALVGDTVKNSGTLADVMGLAASKRHAMYGGAVTPTENTLAEQFIPAATDKPDIAKSKLSKLADQLNLDQQSLAPSSADQSPSVGNVFTGGAPVGAPVSSIPSPAATPKSLTPDIAKQILQQAGGDKDAARQLAKQQGYSF